MIIIKVDADNDKCEVSIKGKPAHVCAELVTAIKAFHDSMTKNTPLIYQNLAHVTVRESVKIALNLIDD